MIINENNKNSLKGTMLRGFNNTPENIRSQIDKANMMAEKMKKPQENTPKTGPQKYNPGDYRETIRKMNSINK